MKRIPACESEVGHPEDPGCKRQRGTRLRRKLPLGVPGSVTENWVTLLAGEDTLAS